MNMPMMDVRKMRMFMGDHLVSVCMNMRLVSIPFEIMHMLMMLIMQVAVTVFKRLMGVFMLMPLCEV